MRVTPDGPQNRTRMCLVGSQYLGTSKDPLERFVRGEITGRDFQGLRLDRGPGLGPGTVLILDRTKRRMFLTTGNSTVCNGLFFFFKDVYKTGQNIENYSSAVEVMREYLLSSSVDELNFK